VSENTVPEAIRAAEITAALHGAPDNRDHAAVRAYLHRLCRLGLAVLFVHPGTKKPADLRTGCQRNADDRAAQHSARDAGRLGWQKVKSPSGLALATNDAAVLEGYLDTYIDAFSTADDPVAVNVAVELGGSRLVIIDADTPGQVRAALADGVRDVATVNTPGSQTADGVRFPRKRGGIDNRGRDARETEEVRPGVS